MTFILHHIINFNGILIWYTRGGGGKLSEEQRRILNVIIISFFVFWLIWGAFILIRYYLIRQLIQKKMRWSHDRDAFWNYNKIIESAEQAYVKAQLFLNATKYEALPFLNPHAKARLRLIKKRIKSEHDLLFPNSFIVSFIDKIGHEFDEVSVYLEIKNKNTNQIYRELLVLKREEEDLIIKNIIRNPTIYMIAHARSIVKKH